MTSHFGVVLSILLGALVVVVVIGLGVGAVYTPPSQVVDGLFNGSGLIWKFRMPRILIGILAGAGMAVSGCLLQASLRNPMAAPDTVGIAAGGGLAAVILLLGVGAPPPGLLTPVAMVGACAGAAITLGLSGRGIGDPVRLALTGVAVSVGLAALTRLLLVRAAPEAGAAMMWLKGSLYARTLSDALVVAPIMVVAIVATLVVARHLDMLALDDLTTQGVGVNPTVWRVIAVILAVISGAAAVAAAGVLGFAGLIVPHAVRMLVGSRMLQAVPISALAGAILVVGCDAFGRWAFAPTEIPVGALISVVGAPYFIYLLIKLTGVGGSQ